METYKITFTTKDGTRDVKYCSFHNLDEALVWTGGTAKNILDLQAYAVERVVADMEGYLVWLPKQAGTVDVLQQVAQFLFFDDGDYDEEKPVDGGDLVELALGQLALHALTVEDYLKERDMPAEAIPESREAEDTQCETIARRWLGLSEQDRREQMEALRKSSPTLYSIAAGKLVELQDVGGKETLSEEILDQLNVIYMGLEHLIQLPRSELGVKPGWGSELHLLKRMVEDILKPYVESRAYIAEAVGGIVPGMSFNALCTLARTAINKAQKQ